MGKFEMEITVWLTEWKWRIALIWGIAGSRFGLLCFGVYGCDVTEAGTFLLMF